MKKEELFEALGGIDPDTVAKARSYHGSKKSVWMRWIAVAACAAIVVGAIYGVPILRDHSAGSTNGAYPRGVVAVIPKYPEPVASALSAEEFYSSDVRTQWQLSHAKLAQESHSLQAGMCGYYTALMEQMLPSEHENTVCSPINIYIAFAMLAEVSDGNTRQQILELLGVADIETLRENVAAIWNSNYLDTPVVKSVLANSLWLNSEADYRDETLKRLAEQYYAAAFRGTPGSEEMNQALRMWTDDNTGGLLSEDTKNMTIAPDAVLEVVSTIYLKAQWTNEFREAQTTKEVFHGTFGDTTVDMMHRTFMTGVYCTQRFTSLALGLKDSGSMYFVLPAEGVDVNTLVSDPDLMKILDHEQDPEKWVSYIVNLSVPKFRVSGRTDLTAAARALGVTDALDAALSDFTPLTTERDDIYLSKAEHAAMIEIDEQGVTGAAYTEILLAGAGTPPEEELDFVLDRPFLFLVTGRDGSILFSGIIRNMK